jgi:hypothetical protein
MTIHVTITNSDTRANAIIEILATDECIPYSTPYEPLPTYVTTKSEGLLRGGESKTVMIHKDRRVEIIERLNEY